MMMLKKQHAFRVLYTSLLTNSICGITQSRSVDITYKAGQKVKDGLMFEERTATSYLHCANICARMKKCMTASYNTDGSCQLSSYRVIFSNELNRISYGLTWATYSKRGRYDDCRFIGNQCFAIVQKTRDYSAAEAYCAENYGRLAEPQDSTMNSLLRNYISDRYAPAFYWFGLTDRDIEGKFVWNSDGLEPGYTSWGNNEPDSGGQSCVCYRNDGDRQWDSTWCTQVIYFICDILD